jgi:hypothetical protein
MLIYLRPVDTIFGAPDVIQRRMITFIVRMPRPPKKPQLTVMNNQCSAASRLPSRGGGSEGPNATIN